MYPSCICLPRIYPCMYVSMYLSHMYNVKCLKITGFILSVLQTRRLRPRCPRAKLPPQPPGRGLPASSSSGGSRCPWGWWLCPSHLCLHLHVASPLGLRLLFCLFSGHCHWTQGPRDPGRPPLDPPLNPTCTHPVSRQGPVLRFWMSGRRTHFLKINPDFLDHKSTQCLAHNKLIMLANLM